MKRVLPEGPPSSRRRSEDGNCDIRVYCHDAAGSYEDLQGDESSSVGEAFGSMAMPARTGACRRRREVLCIPDANFVDF